MPLLTVNDRGLYCAPGDLYVDPWKPVDFAVITHAHSDHARSGSRHYLTSAPGRGVLQERLGPDAKIEVTGYRATTWLSNGKKFIEAESIAEKRAQKIGEMMIGLELPASAVSVNWKSEPEPCDGVNDPQKRRVTISLKL